MANPFSDPHNSDRDALEDLATHPGFYLLQERLKEEIDDAMQMISVSVGLQEVGRFQGVYSALVFVSGLRELMIEEKEKEQEATEQKTAEQRAYDAFYPSKPS